MTIAKTMITMITDEIIFLVFLFRFITYTSLKGMPSGIKEL